MIQAPKDAKNLNASGLKDKTWQYPPEFEYLKAT